MADARDLATIRGCLLDFAYNESLRQLIGVESDLTVQ